MRTALALLTLAVAACPLSALGDGAALSADEANEGFVSLFNGNDLEGWQGSVQGYAVENGAIVCRRGGNLFTAKEYGNFVLRLEFKVPPGGNNGVGIRTPLEGNPAYAGMEIQVLDDDHPQYENLRTYQYHGSVYGVVPAKRGHLKPAGEWNFQEIRAEGSRIRVTLNGQVIVDADLRAIEKPYIDGHEHPGLLNEKGYIGFLGHGAPVEFRNIRIKEL